MIDNMAFRKLSYGLFVLTASENGRDNGCIINTGCQISDNPKLISIAVNKSNLTNEMIKNTGKFCLSVISEKADFALFTRFGFQSGRDNDKFEGFPDTRRDGSGLKCVTAGTNAFFSCSVISATDFGTHTLFVASVIEAETLSDDPSATYAYYFEHIKPRTQEKKIRGWVCRICGYIYEGETLPPDFICPICKHGAEDFEPMF